MEGSGGAGRGERHFGGRGGASETRRGIEGANYVAGNTFGVTGEPL